MSAPVYLGPQALLHFARDRPIRRSYVSKYGVAPLPWSVHGYLPEQELCVIESELAREMDVLLNSLTRREAITLMLRYGMIDGHEWTLEEVGWYLDKIIKELAPGDLRSYSSSNLVTAGRKFGRWTVLESKVGNGRSLCKCKCGIKRAVFTGSLTSGQSKGCSACAAKQRRKPGWKARHAKAQQEDTRVRHLLNVAVHEQLVADRKLQEVHAAVSALELEVADHAVEAGAALWNHIAGCVICCNRILWINVEERKRRMDVLTFAQGYCCNDGLELVEQQAWRKTSP